MSNLALFSSFEIPPDDVLDEVGKLIDRMKSSGLNGADNKALAKLVRTYPKLASLFPDLNHIIQTRILERIAGDSLVRATFNAQITRMELELGLETASVPERLLIDAVISAWLLYQDTVSLYLAKASVSKTLAESKYWEERLDAAQRRHLRAIESLARTRKLLATSPRVQVNIAAAGGQQINIAGDVSPSTPHNDDEQP
jgi:hypothetical protein